MMYSIHSSIPFINSFTSLDNSWIITAVVQKSWDHRERKMDDWKQLSLRELSKQVSPNLWSQGKDKDAIVNDHLEFIGRGSEEAVDTIPNQLDITYGPDTSHKYDVFGTHLCSNAPVFFWVHGGGWQVGSKETASFVASSIVSCGFRCVVVGYRLAPQVKIHEIQNDVREALKHTINSYPNSELILGGHSAGAHLVSSLLHTTGQDLPRKYAKRIRGLFLVSGVYDLRVMFPTYVNYGLQMLPDEAEGISPLLHKKLNPHFQNEISSGNSFPISVIVGKFESPIFQFQSQAYAAHLQNLGCKSCHLLVTKDDDHFSTNENFARPGTQIQIHLQNFLNAFKQTSKL